jgi:hypothetical protein
MATAFEELRVLREAEAVADGVWQQVVEWEPFASLFSEVELEWLQTAQSPISNLQSPIRRTT